MTIWDELGIAPTQDRSSLRRAYALRVKQVKPEVDPAGFQRLRQAYEEALRQNEEEAAPETVAEPVSTAAEQTQGAVVEELPAPPVFQTAVEVVQALQEAPAGRRKELLYEAMKAEGREDLDFQAALQRVLARLLLQHFDRHHALVAVLAERFGWEEDDDALHENSPVAELMGRSIARRWRLRIEASGPSDIMGVRGALHLLRGPITPTTFESFASRKQNLADMREVLRQLLDDCPQALRYETHGETVQWWRRRVELEEPIRAKSASAAGQSAGMRFSFWWIILFLIIVGQVGRCANSTAPGHASDYSRSSHSHPNEFDPRPHSPPDGDLSLR